MENCVLHGDCMDIMGQFEPDSVDLIMTSPPYGNQRKSTYGGIDPDKYVEWFLPRSAEMMRVLKPTGSFVLNIKEHVEKGERHPYVLQLILALREQGWRWVEEYMWLKKNANSITPFARLKDQWERLLHFALVKDFKFRPKRMMVPAKTKPQTEFKDQDYKEQASKTKSGFRTVRARWASRDKAYPSNVITAGSHGTRYKHAAMFPVAIPEFFIKLMTDAGDLVLDPFCGSGTTCEAARNLNRSWTGIDNNEHSVSVARKRMGEVLI